MNKLTYLAVFEPNDDGSFSIYFPDLPGCISVGRDMEHAVSMATEAASLHTYSMEKDGDEIPAPSTVLSKEDTDGNIVVPITIYPEAFRLRHENRRVKTNTSIPYWLKQAAEAQKVNYSQILETALLDYLHLDTHTAV